MNSGNRLKTLGRHFYSSKKNSEENPIKVTVTGGAGNIGYALAFMIGQGRMFGPNRRVSLTLLEIPQVEKALEGVLMELRDCALPLLSEIKGFTNYKEGFEKCEIAILVGARPRGPGMERKDLLGANAKIFKDQGIAINDFASSNCKVLVVGNPANTNALICSLYANKLPKENFTALTRLDQNRANYQVANKLGVAIENIKNIIIWGNHSSTQFPDVNHGMVENYPMKGISSSLRSTLNNTEFIEKNFVTTVAKRGAAIIEARKLSSAASAANAICDHIHDWIVGTKKGEFVSMGVITNGAYGIPKNLNFSFPIICSDKNWKIVEGLNWDEFSKKKIETTVKELLEEREMALTAVNYTKRLE